MISWVAMDRIVERERAADAGYRKQAAGKVLRSDAKRLTDGELVAKLSSFGIELDRPSLERLCDQVLSAEEIAQPLLDQRTFHGKHDRWKATGSGFACRLCGSAGFLTNPPSRR